MLELVLQLLQKHKLYAKLSKCSFGLPKVDYLGHTVSGQGVSMDKDKVQAVLDWPTPINIKQLRGFTGLGAFERVVIILAKIEKFHWLPLAFKGMPSIGGLPLLGNEGFMGILQ